MGATEQPKHLPAGYSLTSSVNYSSVFLRTIAAKLPADARPWNVGAIMSEQNPKQIYWRDEYSIGVPSIDGQHKRLLALLNQLNSYSESSGSDRIEPQRLSEMLDYLNEYAASHFVNEETLMRDHFPAEIDTTDHLVAHRSYWTIIAAMKSRLLKGDAKVNADLVEYLNRWWINHILRVDQEMGRELNRRGIV